MDDASYGIEVTEIQLSPISALFKIRKSAEKDKLIDEMSIMDEIISAANPSVKMNDGGIINWENAHTAETAGYDGDNDVVTQYYIRFSDVIDADDVEGIITDGNVIGLR